MLNTGAQCGLVGREGQSKKKKEKKGEKSRDKQPTTSPPPPNLQPKPNPPSAPKTTNKKQDPPDLSNPNAARTISTGPERPHHDFRAGGAGVGPGASI